MMIMKLLGLRRCRQLHTFISREIIKPSSPTPSHVQTYNLSPLDQLAGHSYSPLILLYANNGNCSLSAHEKAQVLKRSLSQTLTRYYPIAGRLNTPKTPYVDCTDEGVIFVEAKNNSELKIFQDISGEDATLEQLFPDGMVWNNAPRCSRNIVGIQVNNFACGGMAVAVSMSHIIGDGCTLGSFLNYWASVARYGSTDTKGLQLLNPHFIHSQRTNSTQPEDHFVNEVHGNRVIRKFVFPNTKLSDLKKKVMAAGSTTQIKNPTRVEVLTSLLYKTAVAAATKNSGCFKRSILLMGMDLRSKFVPKLPQTTVGNFLSGMMIPTRQLSETSLSAMVAEIKNQKTQLEGIHSVQHTIDHFKTLLLRIGNEELEDVSRRSYWCTSLCGFPYNKVDFGWGKPMDSTLSLRSGNRIGFVLKDTPDGDGIEALATLEKDDMEIFQSDSEMLSFC